MQELADAVRLREGAEGVSRALWAIYREDAHTTHEWSRELGIPVPVLAALRRELEKREILRPGRGLAFTETGLEQMQALFGRATPAAEAMDSPHQNEYALSPELFPLLEEFEYLSAQRPRADVTLDQSHATAETCIRRAALLWRKGLLGKSLLFMGDDDLISLACWLARDAWFEDPERLPPIYALDVDPRYLDFIGELSDREIITQPYDVREELPQNLHGVADVALTDPAYTTNAVIAFAWRCYQATVSQGRLFLSIPPFDAQALGETQTRLTQMGWALRSIYPKFNQYLGASIHAHVSDLNLLEKFMAKSPEKCFEMRYTPFYTGDTKTPGGHYQCTACASLYLVGPGQTYATIQDLKAAGCDECGNDLFTRLPGGADSPQDNHGSPM